MKVVTLACIALVASTTAAFAWGASGHSIIAELAQHRLTPAAEAGVEALLGQGASLASVASWADDERARDKKTTRWHFVDIPSAAADYVPLRDCVADPQLGDCLIAAIEREAAVVACAAKPESDRRRALMFLVHLVGDLHQPLHAVEDQRGGNGINVTITTQEGVNGNVPFNTNLHSAWDAALIDKTVWSWGGYVERLETGWLTTADAAAIGSGTPIEWALETHALAITVLQSVPPNIVLDDAYRRGKLGVMDQQLGTGGIRLAKVLNDAFAANACN